MLLTKQLIAQNVNMFEMYSDSRTRGHQFEIKIQQTYLKRHYFFSTRVVPIWNNLRSNVVLETSVDKFKSSLSIKFPAKRIYLVIMTNVAYSKYDICKAIILFNIFSSILRGYSLTVYGEIS